MCVLVSKMEEQPGTKLVPFCVERMGLQTSTRYFHTGFIPDQVTIRFQLVNQLQRNFRIKDSSMAEKVSAMYIAVFNLYNKFRISS